MGADTTKILKPGEDKDKSDDTNPLIPDKIEADLKKSKFGRWLLWALSLVIVPVGGWAGNKALDVYNSFEDLREQVKELQHDASSTTAIWKGIGENRDSLNQLKIQNETMSRLFDREFQKSVFDRYLEFKLMQEMHPIKPDDGPKPVIPPPPLPVPLPPDQRPPDKAERPKPKPFDAELFRKEYEDKYPRLNTQQKK